MKSGWVVAIALGLGVLAGGVYFLLFARGSSSDGNDKKEAPLALELKGCGDGDVIKGADPQMCTYLGVAYLRGKDLNGTRVEQSDAKARAWFKRMCDQAVKDACDLLTDFDARKLGFAADDCQAKDGDAAACILAGDLLVSGKVDRDVVRARKMYEQACKLGDKHGCEQKDAVQ